MFHVSPTSIDASISATATKAALWTLWREGAESSSGVVEGAGGSVDWLASVRQTS